MSGYSAIALHLAEDAWWVLSVAGSPEVLDPDDAGFPELRPGLKAHEVGASTAIRPAIELVEEGGGLLIRLLETRRYDWEIIGAPFAEVSSSLEVLSPRQWSKQRGKTLRGAFTLVNYLGRADFCIMLDGRGARPSLETWEYRYALEITSTKLDYHSEFRRITEDIAEFCQQLLLSWEAPTSLTFASNPAETARIMLERFLFLRAHLSPVRLEELLEVVCLRPDSRLVRESAWRPLPIVGSSDWMRDPMARARAWGRGQSGCTPFPGEVLDVRKTEAFDTPANRFVKFALTWFRDLCREVLEKHPGALNLVSEARELLACLDAVLVRPFFREVGSLTRLPLDNPTLQRRPGYREILRAWVLTQAASVLAWEQDEDAFGGPTRNVATLYEYWVFLQLHQILDGMDGVTRDMDSANPAEDAEPFLSVKDGELHIRLKRGQKTLAGFTYCADGGLRLRLHLYYERSFHYRAEPAGGASYSRQFKPDYTLAIFPASFKNENGALAAGKIAYLHFDAKYRAENLKSLFGDESFDVDEDKIEGKTISTYKRGDLLKMHTYNDAVRQTAGSYVLYPGSDFETRMTKFHEIVPGVGAFALRPGRPECREALAAFLKDVFLHQADQFTQYRHVANVIHATVREEPVAYCGGRTHRPGAMCMLIHTPNGRGGLFCDLGVAFCPLPLGDALRSVDGLQFAGMAGSVICGYEEARIGTLTSLPWLAAILSTEIVSESGLKKALKGYGWSEEHPIGEAPAYFLFRLDAPSVVASRDVTHLLPRGTRQAMSCTLEELEACSVAEICSASGTNDQDWRPYLNFE